MFQSKKKIYASGLTMVGGKVFSYPENFRLYKVKQIVTFVPSSISGSHQGGASTYNVFVTGEATFYRILSLC